MLRVAALSLALVVTASIARADARSDCGKDQDPNLKSAVVGGRSTASTRPNTILPSPSPTGVSPMSKFMHSIGLLPTSMRRSNSIRNLRSPTTTAAGV